MSCLKKVLGVLRFTQTPSTSILKFVANGTKRRNLRNRQDILQPESFRHPVIIMNIPILPTDTPLRIPPLQYQAFSTISVR